MAESTSGPRPEPRPRRSRWAALLAAAALAASPAPGAPAPGRQQDDPPGAPQAEAAIPQDEDTEIALRLGISRDQVKQLHAVRGIADEALRAVPPEMAGRLTRTLALPDLPLERMAFRFLEDRNEEGLIPEGARQKALLELQAFREAAPEREVVAGVPVGKAVDPADLLPQPVPAATDGAAPLAGLQDSTWQSLGPGNVGGRIRSIVIAPEPQDGGGPHVIWVGSVAGGIWRSIDDGTSFVPVDDFMANLAVSCMVIQPTDATHLFAGTGEGVAVAPSGFVLGDALRGAGIFRSVDGGQTFSQLPSTTGPNFRYVNRLAFSADGATLLAATNAGVFRSTNLGVTWDQPAQLAGTTLLDLDFHPTDPLRCVASGRNGRVFRSTDAGQTWTQATGLPSPGGQLGGRVEITYARANGNIVYASVDNNLGQIYRSLDGGATFALRFNSTANLNYLGQQGYYSHALWAGDPADPNLVIVGGIDLWRSTNGGASLSNISTWWDAQDSPHADHHVIVSHPRSGVSGDPNARAAYFGNDGGLYKTLDVSTAGNEPVPPRRNGWVELVNGLPVTQFYGLAGTPASTTVIAGAQDNGTLRFTPAGGFEGWTDTEGGDGGFCAADPVDGTTFYGEYVYATVFRNDNAGGPPASPDPALRYICGLTSFRDWTFKAPPFRIDDAMNRRTNFIAPFLLDPNNRNRLLAGGLSLWRTNNARAPMTATTGPTWASIKAPIGGDPRSHSISAIGMVASPSATGLIWVGHNDGSLFRTTDGTAANPAWQQMDNGNPPLPNRFVQRVVVDPADTDRVYVSFGGYSSGNIWRTDDGGANWVDIGGSLPEAPVRSIALHPTKPGFVYLGTEVGIFASEDSGATWSSSNEGPTNCSVDDLLFIDNVLHAATHGRGLFRIKLP